MMLPQTAVEIRRAVAAGRASAADICDAALERIEALDARICAFRTLDADRARQRAAELDRLQRAYQRREAVCDRLKEIALATNDAALELEANRLLDLAMKLYEERSNRLLGVASMKMEEVPAAAPKPGRTGPLPPRLRSGGSLEPESYNRPAGVREGDR